MKKIILVIIAIFLCLGAYAQENIDNNQDAKKEILISNPNDTSEKDAINFAKMQMASLWPEIEAYKEERLEFEASDGYKENGYDCEWKGQDASDYWIKRNEDINYLLKNAGYGSCSVSGTQIKNLNRSTVEAKIKENYLKTTDVGNAIVQLDELADNISVETKIQELEEEQIALLYESVNHSINLVSSIEEVVVNCISSAEETKNEIKNTLLDDYIPSLNSYIKYFEDYLKGTAQLKGYLNKIKDHQYESVQQFSYVWEEWSPVVDLCVSKFHKPFKEFYEIMDEIEIERRILRLVLLTSVYY